MPDIPCLETTPPWHVSMPARSRSRLKRTMEVYYSQEGNATASYSAVNHYQHKAYLLWQHHFCKNHCQRHRKVCLSLSRVAAACSLFGKPSLY